MSICAHCGQPVPDAGYTPDREDDRRMNFLRSFARLGLRGVELRRAFMRGLGSGMSKVQARNIAARYLRRLSVEKERHYQKRGAA